MLVGAWPRLLEPLGLSVVVDLLGELVGVLVEARPQGCIVVERNPNCNPAVLTIILSMMGP